MTLNVLQPTKPGPVGVIIAEFTEQISAIISSSIHWVIVFLASTINSLEVSDFSVPLLISDLNPFWLRTIPLVNLTDLSSLKHGGSCGLIKQNLNNDCKIRKLMVNKKHTIKKTKKTKSSNHNKQINISLVSALNSTLK